MESNSAPQSFNELLQFFAQQQSQFQAQLQEQMHANNTRLEALAAKPPAARKAEPPTYQGLLEEDLELWIFSIEQYYADFYPQMNEASPAFVTMVSCHLGATPMNWYRQFSPDCQRTGTVKSWHTFTDALRKRFLPPDHEFSLREKLYQLKQKDSVHDYVSDFQNILIQCRVPISPMELRFYFQSGLRADVAAHLREEQPATLDECLTIALRYDHAATRGSTSSTENWMSTATCHRCKQVGHIAPNCPNKTAPALL